MISAPIRNAYMDDPQALAACRRAAWAVYKDKKHPGFRLLGTGHFSAVFSVPNRPGLVLKVGGPGGVGFSASRGRMRDAVQSQYHSLRGFDVWPEWVRVCAGRCEEWMPRVYHVEALNAGIYFAVMERLESGSSTYLQMSLDEKAALGTSVENLMDERLLKLAMLDIHSENIMMRGDQYVITDPISPRGRNADEHVAWPGQ